MSEEFDLSNCITEEPQISYIPTFKVKEFIRLLKEEPSEKELNQFKSENPDWESWAIWILYDKINEWRIDKLAGEEFR